MWKHREIAVLADSAHGETALEARSLGLRGHEMHRFIDGEDRMQQALLERDRVQVVRGEGFA
jgi:hypothetical protein